LKCLYNFTARNEKELNFSKGDVILVESSIAMREAGWWVGELNGKLGRFPSNYCEIFGEAEKKNPTKMKALHNFEKRKDTEVSFEKGDIITVLEQHKSGWWQGECNGQVGKFPSNYCEPWDDLHA
jgi:hypothetical protein